MCRPLLSSWIACVQTPLLPLGKIGEGAPMGRGALYTVYTGYFWTTGFWQPVSRAARYWRTPEKLCMNRGRSLLSKRLQRFDVIQTEPPFLPLNQEDKKRLCLQDGPLGTKMRVYNEKG